MEKQITPANMGSTINAVLKPIKSTIEDAHRKEVEFMEWEGNYIKNTLTYHFKFKGEPDRYSDAPQSFTHESSSFSDMMLNGLKKRLPIKQVVAFKVVFDMKELDIKKTILYYINNEDKKSIYDSSKKDG